MLTLFVHTQSTLTHNQLRVFESVGEQSGRLIAYSEHRLGTPKDALFLYGTEHGAEIKEGLVCKVKLRSPQDVEPTYDITDEENTILGCIQKEFSSSKWHESWRVYSTASEAPVAFVKEHTSKTGALVQAWRALPFAGEYPFIGTFTYTIDAPLTNQQLGIYRKQHPFSGMHRLDIQPELIGVDDWRVFAIMCAAASGLLRQ